MMNVNCPVCDEYVFTEEFELCPICGWQYDKIQIKDYTYWGGLNELCVNDFKAEWFAKSLACVQTADGVTSVNLNELLDRSVIVGLLDGTFKKGTLKYSNEACAREAIDLLIGEKTEGVLLDTIEFITKTSDVVYVR